jgi:hypothetical protein
VAGRAAFLLATFAAGIFALSRFAELSSDCDGGVCALAFPAALIYFGVAWAIVFPVAWAVLAAMQRIANRDAAPPQPPPPEGPTS